MSIIVAQSSETSKSRYRKKTMLVTWSDLAERLLKATREPRISVYINQIKSN